jgi:gliding motility-associated-like protein
MRGRLFKTLFSTVILFAFNIVSKAQTGLCPPNLDFEQGNFTNWLCRTGVADLVGGVNTITWTATGPNPTLHRMITAPGNSDLYGRFPELCPNGSGFTAKIGNETASVTGGIGKEASGISYTYTIPATTINFSVLFQYAIVLENPGHLPEEQPRFRARIRDLSTGNTIPCVTFDFTASGGLPGFLPSPVNPNVIYKDWTPVTLNLSGLAGRTIEIEFIVSECTRNGHFAYAYVDVNSNCNGAITGTYICPGNPGITLTAPFGFQNYTWYSDNTFATVLSSTQTLTLNPAPAVGTIFPVVVEPYPGFGCRDTLYADVQVATAPVSNAGPDQQVCIGQQVQIGGAPTPGYTYSWSPAGQISNPTSSNPFAWVLNTTPAEFEVITTDILTGCQSRDTTVLTGQSVDTSMVVTGKTTYCVGDANPGLLTLGTTEPVTIQWYDGVSPIAGANSLTFQPTASGNYWAQLQGAICTDSTRIVAFMINPLPIANAGPDASVCSNQQIQLGVVPDPANTYAWTPTAQVSNPAIANPMAWPLGTTPQQFIVQVVNAATGCSASDTTIITGLVVDTALNLAGKKDFCNGDPAGGVLTVNSSLAAVQWYNGNTAIPGATGASYQPLITGNYWAQVSDFGCTDSTLTIPFNVYAIPVALFTPSSDTGCVTNNSFTYTNNSTVSDGSAMSYLWQFSDGTTQTITDAVKSFSATGTFTVRLITTTGTGCADTSAFSTVRVMPNSRVDFTWDSICIGRPAQFYNLSEENGSPQVNYHWMFTDGIPDVFIKDPQPVTYTTLRQANVTLTATALGCESQPVSVIKPVQCNVSHPGIRYRDITVPQGSTKWIQPRDTIGSIFSWRPQVQLSSYNARYTEFTAISDVTYFINIQDIHTCVTVDTLHMLVLKKPGYYLPTAFTPNGDGLNDIVRPYLVGMKSLKSFSIFNRWGNLIFYSTREGEGWDGKSKGITQDGGVYVWMLEFYTNDNKLVTEKGTITLIR